MARLSVSHTGQITALTTGDFDGDGRNDVVVVTDGTTPNLFLSCGLAQDGTLGAVEPIDEQTAYTGSTLVPLNNEATGALDLYTLLPFGVTQPSSRILHNDGSGTFGSPLDLEIPTPDGGNIPTPVAVAVGHSPGLEAPYIACADFANGRVIVFVDIGAGYETASSITVSNVLISRPVSIVAADLEADGDDDLVVGFDDAHTVLVLTCLGRGRFAPITLPSGFAPRLVTAGDIDGNGLPDILEAGGFDTADSHFRVIFSNCGGM